MAETQEQTSIKGQERALEILRQRADLHAKASELRLENAKLKQELVKLVGSDPRLATIASHPCCW